MNENDSSMIALRGRCHGHVDTCACACLQGWDSQSYEVFKFLWHVHRVCVTFDHRDYLSARNWWKLQMHAIERRHVIHGWVCARLCLSWQVSLTWQILKKKKTRLEMSSVNNRAAAKYNSHCSPALRVILSPFTITFQDTSKGQLIRRGETDDDRRSDCFGDA